jgi:hypothetical protein
LEFRKISALGDVMYAVILAVTPNATAYPFFMTFYKTFDIPLSLEYIPSHIENRSSFRKFKIFPD